MPTMPPEQTLHIVFADAINKQPSEFCDGWKNVVAARKLAYDAIAKSKNADELRSVAQAALEFIDAIPRSTTDELQSDIESAYEELGDLAELKSIAEHLHSRGWTKSTDTVSMPGFDREWADGVINNSEN